LKFFNRFVLIRGLKKAGISVERGMVGEKKGENWFRWILIWEKKGLWRDIG